MVELIINLYTMGDTMRKDVDKKLTNIVIEGADRNDYPDFSDAYIASADDADGRPLTEDELDKLNEEYPEIAQQHAMESLL